MIRKSYSADESTIIDETEGGGGDEQKHEVRPNGVRNLRSSGRESAVRVRYPRSDSWRYPTVRASPSLSAEKEKEFSW